MLIVDSTRPGRSRDVRFLGRRARDSEDVHEMRRLFTIPGAWSGGFYELAMEFVDGAVTRASRAHERLWSHPSLDGCFRERGKEPEDQERVDVYSTSAATMLYGIEALPNGKNVPCASAVSGFGSSSQWLELMVPLGSLGNAYPVGAFPFDWRPNLEWQSELDSCLRAVADYVFAEERFQLALIGFEPEFDKINARQIEKTGIPRERFDGILLPRVAGLTWYPATSPLFRLPARR